MTTYERSITIDADLESVFDYMSQVSNLPEYMDKMTSAEPLEGDAVRTTALVDIPGKGETEVESEAWFRVDAAAHRIEWGSEGDNDYHGSLDASSAAGGAGTMLVITLHTLTEHGDHIYDSMDSALKNVARATAPD